MFNVFGNVASVAQAAHWYPKPTGGRGTWNILQTCIITLLLCVWTAIHLNLPGREELDKFWSWPVLLKKIRWLVLGVLAPEIVVLVAAYQLREVRIASKYVSQRVNDYRNERAAAVASHAHKKEFVNATIITSKQEDNSLEGTQSVKWSLQQGFFIWMGGIAFPPTQNRSKPFLPIRFRNKRYTLSLEEAILVAEECPELLDPVSDHEIKDNGKSDDLAKAIVCLQASWFIAQCISRLATDLPISLLELNRFGHSVCAVLIFALWWHKPLGVTEPIYLRGEKAEQMLAYFYEKRQKLGNNSNDPEEFESKTERASLIENVVEARMIERGNLYSRGDPWTSTKNWHPFEERGEFDWLIWLVIILAGGIYGGLHAIAWKAPIKSRTEQLLWQVSVCAIICYGPFLFLTFLVTNCIEDPTSDSRFFAVRGRFQFVTIHLQNYLKAWTRLKDIDSWKLRTVFGAFNILVLLGTLFYFLGRLYLVVESFISLFYAPACLVNLFSSYRLNQAWDVRSTFFEGK